MAYTDKNYPSKAAMVRDFKAGIPIPVHQPGPFGPEVKDGRKSIEGPHYPKAHTWYASVMIEDGRVVKVLK